MPRIKVAAEPVLHDWNEVDIDLRQIATLKAEIDRDQAELDREIAVVKGRFEPAIVQASAKIKRAEKDIEEFAEAHRAELEQQEGRRSKVLNWGLVSFRRSKVLEALTGLKLADVVDRLERFKAEKFLRIKKEVNKEAVKTALDAGDLPESKLERFGLRLVEKDTFGYELAAAPIADRNAAAPAPIVPMQKTA